MAVPGPYDHLLGGANGPSMAASQPASAPAPWTPPQGFQGIQGGTPAGPGAPGAYAPPAPAAPATPQQPTPPNQGGGGGGGVVGTVKAPAPGFNNKLHQMLSKMVSGKMAPFNPGTLDNLNQQTAETARAQEMASRDQVMRDAISRGMTYSGATSGELAATSRAAGASITQGTRANSVEAAKANYEARSKAISQSQQWLDSMRTWVLNSNKADMEKQQMLASIASASASAHMQQQQLQMGIVEQILQAQNQVL